MSTVIFIYMPSRQKDYTDNPKIFGMGEEKAFDFFFRQYYSALCYFANTIINDEDDAKDIVQECFIKLWNSQTLTDRSETVKSFLYTIVRNRCLDVLRKKKVIRKAESELKKIGESPSLEYFDEVAFAEMIRLLNQSIGTLSSKVQEIFKLYYQDGKNHQEIAAEIKCTPEAVRKQKARALKSIRRKFLLLF